MTGRAIPARVVSLAWAVLVAVMPGVAAARLFDGPDLPDGIGRAVRFAVASALLVGFVAFLWMRRRKRWDALSAWNRRALPLLTAPVLVLLADTDLVSTRGGLALGSIAAFALTVASSRLAGPVPAPMRRRRATPWVILAAALLVGGWLSSIAWVRHDSMQTNTYDLGLFVNAIWNTSQGRWFVCTLVPTGSILDEHVSLMLVVFAALMKMGLTAKGLLALQAMWLCAGAVPAYLLARRHLGEAGGVVFAAAYLLHPSVHANALWDFHPLSFTPPLVLWMFVWGRTRRLRPAFLLCVLALLMLREDMAFVLLAYAATLWLDGRARRAALVGGIAIAFLVGLNLAMGQTTSHVSRYADLAARGGGGLTGLVVSSLFDPSFVLSHALSYGKVVYVGMQGVGVLLLPALARRRWPLLGVTVAFSVLATSKHVSNPYFHYTSLLLPIVFGLAPAGASALLVWTRGFGPIATRRRALVHGVFAGSLALSFAYGGLHDNESFRAGFRTPRRTLSEAAGERVAWLRGALEGIPDGTSMAVTGRVGPHVAQRPAVYAFPPERPVELMIVFRGDLRRDQRTWLQEQVASGAWSIVESTGSLSIYRRNP
ncbi:MAG: DUF2079 domain-containing protein [Myxococcota bacterium]